LPIRPAAASSPDEIAAASLAALVIGALVPRTKGIYFIMATLAFAQMLYSFSPNRG